MNESYIKTLLYLYPRIDDRINYIEEQSIKLGFNSMYHKTFEVIEAIYHLYKEKYLYTMIKNVIDIIKSRLSLEQLGLLEYKYFRDDSIVINKDFDYTSRGYFRKQNALLKQLSVSFALCGFTDEFFEKECLKYEFINTLLNNIKTGEIKYVRNYKR